jgi:uncharacterized protein (TIGR03435 family)
MRHCIFCACLVLILACAYCPAQSDQSPHFEAASIKPAAGPEMFSGGPGTGRATFEGTTTLETLISMAYDLGLGHLAGPPWISTEWYAISTRYPSGTTEEQFRQMLANLLNEQLELVVHRVTKEVIGYELTVAPGGPGLSPAKPESAADTPSSTGVAAPHPGMSWDSRKEGNMTHMTFRRTSMAFLEYQVRSILSGSSGPDETIPVIDRTGLTGHFDFDLEIPQSVQFPLQPNPRLGEDVTTNGDSPVDPSSISNALEKQLGLKLNPVKTGIGYVVVDHVKKAPTSN